MAKDKTEKTNVMRLLEQKKLPYTPHDYLASGAVSGVEVAAALGEPPERVFKTLVTTGASGGHYVFVIPAVWRARFVLVGGGEFAGEIPQLQAQQRAFPFLPLQRAGAHQEIGGQNVAMH